MVPGWEKPNRNHFAAVFDSGFLLWHLEIWQLHGFLPSIEDLPVSYLPHYKIKINHSQSDISLPQTPFPSVPRKNKGIGETLILGAMAHLGGDEWECHSLHEFLTR